MVIPDRSIRICADRGGTFCDVYAYVWEWSVDDGRLTDPTVGCIQVIPRSSEPREAEGHRGETPYVSSVIDRGAVTEILCLCSVSQDAANYRDAPTEGIRRVLEIATEETIPRGTVLKTDKIGAKSQHKRLESLSTRLQITSDCRPR